MSVMGRSLLKFVLYGLGIAALIGLYAMHSPEAFTPVPHEKHEALVGDWYVERFGSFRHYVFREDGTGEIWTPGRETQKFFWGTDNDRLRLKYQSYRGWSVPEYRMKFGEQIVLEPLGEGYRLQLTREAPASARLQ